jgi:diguanylate cyclase (GGDEF)-like protein
MLGSRDNSSFARSFLAPLLIVISTTLLALFGLFAMMVRDQNAASVAREAAQVQRGIADRVEFVGANIRDYTLWTDAVDNLAADFNRTWANDNIGPYLFNLQGYDANVVVNADGSTVYASEGPQESTRSAAAIVGKDFPAIMARLTSANAADTASFAELISTSDRPVIVSAAPILPSVGSTYVRPFARRYMIIVQRLDAEMLAKVERSYRMTGLAFGSASDGTARVALRDGKGRVLTHVTWTAAAPGTAMFERFFPWLLLITLNAIGLSVYMLRRAHRATRDLAASETTARHLANHDTLTGLPNRRALLAYGAQCSADRGSLAMVYLDLDGFKEVNDLFGHQAGDVLLREATERLRHVVGRHGLLARVGGDEFAILLCDHPTPETATALAEAIVTAMALPFTANHIKMVVSASVGIALGRTNDTTEELSRLADIAMYAAKHDGRNRWRVYTPEMSEGRELRKRLESELRDALKAGEVEVMFQPIVEARNGRTCCLEALARWTSPTAGPVGPAIFVPIAEESGLIVELGEYILRRACTEARDWETSIAVNLSPAQFWHTSLADDILAILKECDFPPERLELEITEGYLLSRPELATKILAELRSKGIRIALDDFGTGFASIGYLRRFELDKIKLDRSFVEMVDHDVDSALVAQAVVALSKSFKLPITAEGVETEGQATMLTVAGCDRLQGWRFGYPTPALALLHEHTHPNDHLNGASPHVVTRTSA